MARRAFIAAVTAAAFFAVGLVLAQQDTPTTNPTTTNVEVMGTVTAVTPDQMTIKTDQNQEWKFKLNDQTQRLAGMAVGDRVRVSYKDEWGTDTALNVVRADSTTASSASPSSTAQTNPHGTTGSNTYRSSTGSTMTTGTNQGNTYRHVDGTIVSFTPTEIVLRTDDGKTETYTVTPGMDRTYFTEGKRVRLNFEMDENQSGKLMARQVSPVTGSGGTTSTAYTTVARNDRTGDRNAASDTMPNTGSSLPSIALLGLISLLGGGALWLGRNRLA